MTERLKNKRNLQTGDIVLLKDYLHHQKYWLTKIFADKHGDIRNVKLKLASIMCTPPLSAGGWGGGGWTSYQFLKKWGLDRTSVFRGGLLGNQFIGVGLPKKGGLGQFAALRGGLARGLERLIPQCTLWVADWTVEVYYQNNQWRSFC